MIKRALSRRGDRHEEALRLLDQERDALTEGDVGGLATIVAAREALVSELLAATVPPPRSFLSALRMRAERNSRLLLASMAGLRTARDQVAEIDRAARSLKTYTAEGAALDVDTAPKTRDRRR
jgi:hypothetical protein